MRVENRLALPPVEQEAPEITPQFNIANIEQSLNFSTGWNARIMPAFPDFEKLDGATQRALKDMSADFSFQIYSIETAGTLLAFRMEMDLGAGWQEVLGRVEKTWAATGGDLMHHSYTGLIIPEGALVRIRNHASAETAAGDNFRTLKMMARTY